MAKGVKRDKNQGRITVTLECTLPLELMSQLPGWQTDATDALRKMVAEFQQTNGLDLVAFLQESGVIVYEKFDVSK